MSTSTQPSAAPTTPASAGAALVADLSDLADLADLATDPGCVHLPGTPGYDAAVSAWNVAVPRTPVAVVAARDAGDVAAAVRWADRRGVRVAVQATGHGATGDLTDVLLISTKAMTGLHIDPAERVARVEAGVRWDQVLAEAAPHGLAGLAGSAPHVGVVGYTTGGGVGPVARTHGLASDRVRAFDVVTGDGELRRATRTENPELFWALCGGKGLLGIVTSVEFELVPLAELYGGALYFDGADAPAVLHRWATWADSLPREATTSVALLRLPPLPSVPPPLAGRLTVAVRFAWCGDPGRGAGVLEPVRSVATPLIDAVTSMPYAALGSIHADPVDPMPTHETHGLLGRLDRDAVDALLAAAGPGTASPQIVVEVRQLGGAVAGPSRTHSAYDRRDAAYSLLAIGLGVPPVVDAARADGDDLLASMSRWTIPGALANFAPGVGPAWLARVYTAETLVRLGRVRQAYDPRATLVGAVHLPGTHPTPTLG